MDEELGVKATRLRRRQSIESEGVQSPATPSTPTKKRAARIAKPALELIDENVPENVPKKSTRKSIARDEPSEEKLVTPSRRSARIRSNTSLVMEPLQSVLDSPRARRAIRRNSHLDSDTETTTTPARTARRTRKDSTSSVENLAVTNPSEKLTVQVTEAITEEPEIEGTNNPKVNKTDYQSPTVRKSPRLKKGRKSNDEAVINEKQTQKDMSLTDTGEPKQSSPSNRPAQGSLTTTNDDTANVIESEISEKVNLSLSSANLIKEVDMDLDKSDINKKTASSIEESSNVKNRKRTKSLTMDKSKEKDNLSHNITDKGYEDSCLKNNGVRDMMSPNKSLNKSALISNSSVENKENINLIKPVNPVSDTLKILEKSPGVNIQSMVFLEDSDSNSGGIRTFNIDKTNNVLSQNNVDDQCVPVVNQSTLKKSSLSESFSVEPMDIDETIPENVTIIDSDKTNSSREEDNMRDSKRKSSISNENSVVANESSNKSKRTSISQQQESINSKRKSSLNSSEGNNDASENNWNKSDNMRDSKRKSSMSNENSVVANESCNKSKRTSISQQQESISSKRKSSMHSAEEKNDASENVLNKSDNMHDSKRRSSISSENSVVANESTNKSKRTSICQQQEPIKSKRKSSINSFEDASQSVFNKSDNENKSKRKSSLSNIESENNKLKSATSQPDNSINLQNVLKSKRKSSLSSEETLNTKRKLSNNSQTADDDKADESANRSKRIPSLSNVETKSSNCKSTVSSQSEDIDKIQKSPNVSKRKSTSETESQNLQNTTSNENKSTLVLSQLRDMSANEVNNASKSPNDNNNELSKSVDIPDVTKKTDKKYLSQSYSTSTPLQQKPLQKLAMQINTSMISPNAETKNASKVNKSPNKKVSKVANDSDTSDEDSQNESNMVDEEAKEACEGYQSGDSRNEEEIEYEKEHEILEKGETLESEDEISTDSDYEKDSFIVSSNEEDDDLLSGSGDDLSLSDNELNMTAKSKKKYDERKRKEQKKASKEMYEARHKLNESDKSSKSNTKKSKRQRLESSLLESEKEEENQPTKNNRLRIDSSQDMNNSDPDNSIRVKKKKTKRLSESICEEHAVSNEKEITIHNQSVTEKNDPLSEAIKLEIETPKKDLNISTVQISDAIENIQVDANVSLIKPTETSDPLQLTLAQEDEELDSDISENSEIQANYSSVLKNLNKTNKQMKIETLDTSLNVKKKKTKDKLQEPIVDQLNLTLTKRSKKDKSQVIKENQATEEPTKDNEVSDQNDGGDTSDSIDMRLLFPEDSNDSESNDNKYQLNKKEDAEPTEKFIPLKRMEAKTDIRKSLDNKLSEIESDRNAGKKRNKNRKSSENVPESANEPEEKTFSFFIDTKGTYDDMDNSTQSSAKKNKKKHKQKMSLDVQNESLADRAVPDKTTEYVTPDVALTSDKKKKKHKTKDTSYMEQDTTLDVSRSGKEKSKKTSKSAMENNVDENVKEDNTSISELVQQENSVKSEKKNKNIDTSTNNEENLEAVRVSQSGKKKSKKTSESTVDIDTENTVAETTITEFDSFNVSNKIDKKKKKNKNNSINNETINDSHSGKKKKKTEDFNEENQTQSENTAPEVPLMNITPSSDDKNKKKKKKSLELSQIEPITTDDVATGSGKKNKNKKNKNVVQPDSDMNAVNPQDSALSSKKRKRDKAINNSADDIDEIKASSSQKKKQKVSQDDEDDDAPVEECISYIGEVRPCDVTEIPAKKFKKKKSKNKSTVLLKAMEQDDTNKKSKKRKATEDHEGTKRSKVFKENSFDEIHVPRLPDSIINQLEDKPQGVKKHKKVIAISTVPFQVEEAQKRKNKPSNYLEQSIYLNEQSPKKSKQKASIKNLKVLPFIPTAITSGKGYTSNFRINLLPQDTEFVAQANNVNNFKNDYLSKQRVKKLGTFERFKRQRSQKISKF